MDKAFLQGLAEGLGPSGPMWFSSFCLSTLCLVIESSLFFYPRKAKKTLESMPSPIPVQASISIFQANHVLGTIRGLAELILAYSLSEYDSLPADLNPDIVGRGARFSVYGPAAGLILSSILGQYHVFDSGAKELAMVQLFTLACYIVNLTVRGTELKNPELLLVLLLADSTSSSLSIALNDKQILSARMLVYAICGAQLSMLGTTGWSLANNLGSTDGPWRYRIVLWGCVIDSSIDPLDTSFWILYAGKTFNILKGVVRSMAFTSAFNIAEREAAGKHRTTAPDENLESKRWLGIPIACSLTASTPLKIQYSEQMATTSVAAFEHIFPTITSIISAERLMHQIRPESGDWIEWGQMAQVGITVFGLLHFLYTILYQLMWKRAGSFRRPHHFDEPMREYLRLLERAYPANHELPRSWPQPRSSSYELQNVSSSRLHRRTLGASH